jgi:hypothetical protein
VFFVYLQVANSCFVLGLDNIFGVSLLVRDYPPFDMLCDGPYVVSTGSLVRLTHYIQSIDYYRNNDTCRSAILSGNVVARNALLATYIK